MSESKKMCIVVFGGTVDKLFPAAIMASGAVMNDMEVDIFLTFWGLLAFKKGEAKKLATVSKDYEELGSEMMKMMQANNVPSWYDTLAQAKEMGNVRIYACAMTADLFEMELEDFEPILDDIMGVGEFVGISVEADTTLYLG